MIGEIQARAIAREVLKRVSSPQATVLITGEDLALTRFAESRIHQSLKREDVTLRLQVQNTDGKSGTSETNDLGPDSVVNLVRKAEQAAEHSLPDPALPPPGGLEDSVQENRRTPVEAVTADQRGEAVDKVFKGAAEAERLAFGSYCTLIGEQAVLTSTGRSTYDVWTDNYLRTVLADGEGGQTGYSAQLSPNASDIEAYDLITEAAVRATANTRQMALLPGDYEAVFSPYAVADILRFMGYLGFAGQTFLDGRSFLSGRLGDEVTGSRVTITESPRCALGLVPEHDIEGTRRERVALIKAGVASGVVFDRRCAREAGGRSTGHATHWGPLPSVMEMAPGTAADEHDLITRMKRGVYVTRFHYTHCPDPLHLVMTGTTRDGTFLVENGQIKGAVSSLRLTDSIPRILFGMDQMTVTRQLVRDWWGTFSYLLPAIHTTSARFVS
jgi:predicted Zn-dependent protease